MDKSAGETEEELYCSQREPPIKTSTRCRSAKSFSIVCNQPDKEGSEHQ